MNDTVCYDAAVSDDVRRHQLYDGQLFVFSPCASILNFVEFARAMIEEAFGAPDIDAACTRTVMRNFLAAGISRACWRRSSPSTTTRRQRKAN